MNISTAKAALAATLLVGCALQPTISPAVAVSQDIPTIQNRERGTYKVSTPLLFVTNADSPPYDAVTIYDAEKNNPHPIAVINANTSQPGGACIDAQGTLYVANGSNSGLGWIAVYALGETQPRRLITEGINGPAFCAIDAAGNLWVTNSAGATATEYLKGKGAPHFTLRTGLTSPDGIAIDHAGYIYVGNLLPYGVSNIQVYLPGKKSPARTITDGVTWPVGIAVDPAGTLYVTNDVAPCNVAKYHWGKNHPYEKITEDIDGPTAATFNNTGRMYEVNEGASGCASNGSWPLILEFRPGSRVPLKKTIAQDLHTPVGDAYYPPSHP